MNYPVERKDFAMEFFIISQYSFAYDFPKPILKQAPKMVKHYVCTEAYAGITQSSITTYNTDIHILLIHKADSRSADASDMYVTLFMFIRYCGLPLTLLRECSCIMTRFCMLTLCSVEIEVFLNTFYLQKLRYFSRRKKLICLMANVPRQH